MNSHLLLDDILMAACSLVQKMAAWWGGQKRVGVEHGLGRCLLRPSLVGSADFLCRECWSNCRWPVAHFPSSCAASGTFLFTSPEYSQHSAHTLQNPPRLNGKQRLVRLSRGPAHLLISGTTWDSHIPGSVGCAWSFREGTRHSALQRRWCQLIEFQTGC